MHLSDDIWRITGVGASRRTRRFIGSVVVAVLCGMWIGSAVATLHLQVGRTSFDVERGGVAVVTHGYSGLNAQLFEYGLGYASHTSRFGFCLPYHMEFEEFNGGGVQGIWIPFWLLAPAMLGVLGALAILCPAKPVPGKCHCGYNLTGNVSGICPECGTAVRVRSDAQRTAAQRTILLGLWGLVMTPVVLDGMSEALNRFAGDLRLPSALSIGITGAIVLAWLALLSAVRRARMRQIVREILARGESTDAARGAPGDY